MKNNTAIQTTNQAISSLANMTPETVELIKNTVAKNSTDLELEMFLHLAKSYNLDPFAKEIWCLKYLKQGQKPQDVAATIMTSRDGYLKIANLNEQMDGIISDTVYEQDKFVKNPDNSVLHTYGNPRGKLIGAYALTYRKDRRFPVYAYAPLDEYKREFNPTWKSNPSAMILKVAEAMSLKRTFSISGLVTKEEMDVADDSFAPTEDVSHEVLPSAKPVQLKPEPVPTQPAIEATAELKEYKTEIIQVLNSPVFTEKERTDITSQLNGMSVSDQETNLAKLKETAYNRELGYAIVEMGKCTDAECAAATWKKYRNFQNAPSFIKAKDAKKEALQQAKEQPKSAEAQKADFGSPTKNQLFETLQSPYFTNAERSKELLNINKIAEDVAVEKLDYYATLLEERMQERQEAAQELYDFIENNQAELGADEVKKFYAKCNDIKVPISGLRSAKEEAALIVSNLSAK